MPALPGIDMTIAHRLRITLEMIKIEHTLFALPFAFLGAALAARELPPQPASFWVWKLFWITVAMVGARSAAMTTWRSLNSGFGLAARSRLLSSRRCSCVARFSR